MARAWKPISRASRGLFTGGLRYTVYRGTNLLRQEVIAKTDAPSVAYKFVAGLRVSTSAPILALVWRDVARGWQHYLFGGHVNTDPGGAEGAQTAWLSSKARPARWPSSRHPTSSFFRAKWNPTSGTTTTQG